MDRQYLKEFMARVDAILWEEWDPIGGGVPKDEYSSYALQVVSKVCNGAEKQEIIDYLFDVEYNKIGLSCTREAAQKRNSPVVEKILQLYCSYH